MLLCYMAGRHHGSTVMPPAMGNSGSAILVLNGPKRMSVCGMVGGAAPFSGWELSYLLLLGSQGFSSPGSAPSSSLQHFLTSRLRVRTHAMEEAKIQSSFSLDLRVACCSCQ